MGVPEYAGCGGEFEFNATAETMSEEFHIETTDVSKHGHKKMGEREGVCTQR